MGLFTPEEKKITKQELDSKVMQELYNRGVKQPVREEMKEILEGHLDETSVHPDERGIDVDEAHKTIERMKDRAIDHKSAISDRDVDALHDVFKQHFSDYDPQPSEDEPQT